MEFYKNWSENMNVVLLDNKHLISIEGYGGERSDVLVVIYQDHELFPVNFDVLHNMNSKLALKDILKVIFNAKTIDFKTRRA